MRGLFTAFSYLLMLSFELAAILAGSVLLARYLNTNHQIAFDWNMVTAPISLVLCCLMIYKFLVILIKSEQKKAKHD